MPSLSSSPWILVAQQGLHFSTVSHLRVRWLKALAQFSPQYQRTRHKEGVFQIIGPTKRSIEKGVADGIVAAIRSHERNGLVELPKPPRLKRGDRVQIVQGTVPRAPRALRRQTSPERVAVLLQLLGGQQRAELPADAIEPLEVGQ
jgi:hypothetical protein